MVKPSDPAVPVLLWGILAVALALRLLGAWSGNLMYDETTHLACAETIDLRPDHFNLVSRSVDHPPMSVYLVRLSEYLFGDSNFGIRILHALIGALTVIPVFLLARRVFSTTAGLWAAGLLAVDQFHMTWSYFIVPEVLLLFFVPLVLLQFMTATESRSGRDFAIAGLYLGLAYLAKETALFLAPALWLTLLFDRNQRGILLDYRLYFMYLVALLVASPDIVNNIIHLYEGYFYRDAGMLSSSWHPSLRVAILYLGELVQHYTGPRGGFPGTGLQNPNVIYWPTGLFYLAATAAAFLQARDNRIRLLLVTFIFVVFAFTALPSHGTEGAYWWASISLIPAVIFAGSLLSRWQEYLQQRGDRRVRAIGNVVLLGCAIGLGIHAIQLGLRPGMDTPRKDAAARIETALARAAAAKTPEDLAKMNFMLTHTLHVTGPHAGLYGYLAEIAMQENQPDKAAYFARRGLELDPQNREAARVSAWLQEQKVTAD